MAAVAVTFATYCSALLGLGNNTVMPIAAGAIALLSAVNYVGVEPGAITNNLFSILKLTALGVLIVVGLAAAPAVASPPAVNASGPLFLALAAALVPVLFAYGGWQQTNFIAEEIVEPEKNLPRALVLGVIIVVIVYVLANLTYLRTLGVGGLAASTAPAADAMRIAVGPVGSTFISAGIAASTFGFLNLVILVSPRVYRTMAADGLFFPQLATLHPKFRTPTTAVVVQGVWGILLLFSGSSSAVRSPRSSSIAAVTGKRVVNRLRPGVSASPVILSHLCSLWRRLSTWWPARSPRIQGMRFGDPSSWRPECRSSGSGGGG
jgi:APA family basic amino acid/polyamine antiporter